jgi:5'-3' exoribonuclease 1
MSGTSLNDRCTPFRGSTVPATAVLNVTERQVVSYSTAAAAKRPQTNNQSYAMPRLGAPGGPQLVPANAPPPLQGSYRGAFGGANTNGASRGRGGGMAPRGSPHVPNGGSGQQQTLPIHGGPPRGGRGGFAPRGQANGTRGGGQEFAPRGRGGIKANRGGFTSTDMSDPTEGVVANNPNFRPQNYSNVPPPANLNGGRGGRGRGRGGFRGRARGGAPAPQ